MADIRRLSYVFKADTAQIVIHGIALPRQVGYQNIRMSVVVIVFKRDAHPRVGLSVFVVCESRPNSDLGESTIPIVPKQLLWTSIIGDNDVRPSVAIEIVNCDTEAIPR